MRKFFIYWLPVILWVGVIFYLSSRPGLASPLPVFYDVFLRKLAHAAEFGILFLLLFRAWRIGHKAGFATVLFWSLVVSVIYALFDEAHQYFVPLREARLRDVGIDSLGVAFCALGMIFWENRARGDKIKNPG